MVSRQQREAKLALKATRLAKQKKRVKKQVRLAALANAAPEIPLVLTAAPARDEPDYDVWQSEAEDEGDQPDPSSSAESAVGDDVNHPVGDDVNHLVGDDVNHPNLCCSRFACVFKSQQSVSFSY